MRPIRVVESFAKPRPTTNPYISQLAKSLDRESDCELILFSFSGAIFGSYDVFHVHWPEVIYCGSTPLKSLRRQILTAAILVRIQLSGVALVRTRHNIARPAGMNRREMLLDRWFDRLTTLNICLNATADSTVNVPSRLVPHGHYREWFPPAQFSAQVTGRLAYFGLIRRYKGVEGLVGSFLRTRTSGLTLSVSGKPSTTVLSEQLVRTAEGDDRVTFDFRFLADHDLVSVVTAAELVVLPYVFMHNSGATLAALSLNRPVLVPDTEVNRALSVEIGPGWVYMFTGAITSEAIDTALAELRTSPPEKEPNLEARDWESVGTRHVAAFRDALDLKRGIADVQAGSSSLPQTHVRGGVQID